MSFVKLQFPPYVETQMNSAVFTSKTMHMWHPVAPEEIDSRWEQFHDCYFPQLPTKYVPRDVSLEETMSWVFFTENLPLIGMECFSEVFWEEKIFLDIVSQKQISCDLCTSIASCKVNKTVGRFQLESPRAYKCKQILGLRYLPPQMENQCGFVDKTTSARQKISSMPWVTTWQTEESVMNIVKHKCCLGEGDNPEN